MYKTISTLLLIAGFLFFSLGLMFFNFV